MLGENATLRRIRTAGGQDEYGDTVPGSTSWDGAAACHIRRKKAYGAANGLATTREFDELIVRLDTGVATALVAGDRTVASTVVVLDRRVLPPVERTFRVAAYSIRQGGGTPADSIAVELADGD